MITMIIILFLLLLTIAYYIDNNRLEDILIDKNYKIHILENKIQDMKNKNFEKIIDNTEDVIVNLNNK